MNGDGKKRSLILAGGGIKVAFQAGVLQVWLDEAGLTFDHADGASGGCLNLAMVCQGMSGRQIADNWRTLNPFDMVSLNWREYAKLFYSESISTLDGLKEKVFSRWGLDWDRIRASGREATFNTYNFSKHELAVLPPAAMTADHLCACVALPMWFPPVRLDGDLYIDAVYITDANVEEAIRRGADEIWVIWTVSEKSEWHDGFVANYFQIVETCANGHFKRILRRIEESNAALARGEAGEFGRPIEVKMIKAEVPLHYLINVSSDRLAEAVNQGVAAAREWCNQQGIPLRAAGEEYPAEVHKAQTRLQFTEEMKGYVGFGETDYHQGFTKGHADKSYLMFHLTIKIDGVNRFVTDPRHEAAAEGWVRADALGGQFPVEKGTFNLLVHDDDPSEKRMLYRLFFRDREGRPFTFVGFKEVKDDKGFDLWSDTTTLYTRLLRGHVGAQEEAQAEIVGSGILRLHQLDFLKQLTTFRVEGPTFADRAAAFARFGRLFLGKLWDVYARDVLPSGPI
jgi:predicted patatin/cPLA2 family phospholipase